MDSAVDYSSNSRIISVGNTLIAGSLGISAEGLELEYSDCLFKTVNGSIFILCGNAYAMCGAVMEYLNAEFGVEVYASDCYFVETKGSDHVLSEINKTVEYDMDIRTTDSQFLTDYDTDHLMGFVGRDTTIFSVSASAHQTLTYYVPYATYKTSHPKWYNNYSSRAESATQVCYNANGDETELKLMKQAFLDKMIWGLNRYPSSYIFIIGNEDNDDFCTCVTCTAKKDTYGTNNASALHFCNDLADMLNEWMNGNGSAYKRDFEILFLAYQGDIGAPSVYNSVSGKYEPIDDTVVCKENVSVFFAPLHMDFKSSIYADVNKTPREAFEGWKACSDEISLYLYQTNYQDTLVFFDSISCMQELYQFFATGNIKFVHSSGNGYNAITPGWEVLTAYLQSVLAKDVNADLEKAKNAFFNNYFGVAAEPMRKYFDSYMEWTKYLRDNHVYDEVAIPVYELLIRKPAYWSTEEFSIWLGYVNEALAAIKGLKETDLEAYEILYDRIILERIPIYYIANEMISSFGASLHGVTANDCRRVVKEDCERLGITSRGRLGDLATLYALWGLL